jgi:hypothetical protein
LNTRGERLTKGSFGGREIRLSRPERDHIASWSRNASEPKCAQWEPFGYDLIHDDLVGVSGTKLLPVRLGGQRVST